MNMIIPTVSNLTKLKDRLMKEWDEIEEDFQKDMEAVGDDKETKKAMYRDYLTAKKILEEHLEYIDEEIAGMEG